MCSAVKKTMSSIDGTVQIKKWNLPIAAPETSVDRGPERWVRVRGPVGGTEKTECAFSCREEDEHKKFE